MKSHRLLFAMMVSVTSSVFAQSKGEMLFTSTSPNANELIRKAWVAMADAKMVEGNGYVQQALTEDPSCAMAYVSLYTENLDERAENLRKAEGMKLSADETMLIRLMKTSLEGKPAVEYFNPLLKKYPKDEYLHLMVMFLIHHHHPITAIGENLIKRNPNFAPAHNLLGYGYMDNNEMEKAQFHFDKYLSLRPDLANPYDSKGDFMMRTGKTEEALHLYEKAASLGMASSKAKAENAKGLLKFPAPTESDVSSIKEIINSCFEAAKRSDVNEMLTDYSDQSIDILGDQRVNVGLPNIRRRFTNMFHDGSFKSMTYTVEPVNGTGPIAVLFTRNEFVWKQSATGNEIPRQNNSIYLMRKGHDGKWKILANHYYGLTEVAPPISAGDHASIEKLLASWDAGLMPGEEITNETLEALSLQYSQQAIEIFQDQQSNIGLPNIRARWAQFLGSRTETNALNPLGVEGFGRRAVAWGIGIQRFYPKGSDQLLDFQFPWAMILTKEKDDSWRILAFHWGGN